MSAAPIEIPAAEALQDSPGLQSSHKACPECGLHPLYYRDQHDQIIRVDGCFKDLLGSVVSACCGHGGRAPAYLHIRRAHSSGTNGCVEICGGRLVSYRDYLAEFKARAT